VGAVTRHRSRRRSTASHVRRLLGQSSGSREVNADTGKVCGSTRGPRQPGRGQIPTPLVKGGRVWSRRSYTAAAALLKLCEGHGAFEAQELNAYRNALTNHHGGMVPTPGGGVTTLLWANQNEGNPVLRRVQTGRDSSGGRGEAAAAERFRGTLYGRWWLYFRYQNGVMV